MVYDLLLLKEVIYYVSILTYYFGTYEDEDVTANMLTIYVSEKYLIYLFPVYFCFLHNTLYDQKSCYFWSLIQFESSSNLAVFPYVVASFSRLLSCVGDIIIFSSVNPLSHLTQENNWLLKTIHRKKIFETKCTHKFL